jgi:hypothetical protein
MTSELDINLLVPDPLFHLKEPTRSLRFVEITSRGSNHMILLQELP